MSPESATGRVTRILHILASFLARVERQARPHPELLEMAGFAVDRFMESAYSVGALQSCLEATRLGMVLTELSQETRPVTEGKALLRAHWAALEVALHQEVARLDEPSELSPGIAPAAAPAAPPATPVAAPAAPRVAPVYPRAVPPASTFPGLASVDAGWPDEGGDGAFAYLGTEEFPFDAELTRIFLTEAGEQVPQVERILLELEADPERHDAVQNLFRLLHTIKGNAGFLGLREFIRLVHAMEQYLEPFRDRAAVSQDFAAALLLEASDALRALLENLRRRCDLLTATDPHPVFEPVPWKDVTGRIQTATVR
jgi:HPt (histidine-containing phosphotransfer) domain-containing protein